MSLPTNYNSKEFESEIYKQWVNHNIGNPDFQKNDEKPLYLIFDCDGVLADSWDVVIKSRVWAGLSKDEQDSILYQSNRHEKSPFEKKAKPNSDSLKGNSNWHQKEWEYIQQFGGYVAFEGFIEELKKLKKLKKLKNLKMAIVSSNGSPIIKDFAKKLDLEFTHVMGFDESPSKEEKVGIIIKDWGVDLNQVLFFTDTKSDVLELENYLPKKNIFAVDWGWHGTENIKIIKTVKPDFKGLETVLPKEQILYKFSDIHKVIKSTHSILMPPPNLTGVMHAGHSFQHFLMDTLSRTNRQNDKTNLWYPGVDHAGLQLEGVIDKLIKKGDFDEEIKKQ
jgi:HAD superfamily hydrolase (TIGR01549 family)